MRWPGYVLAIVLPGAGHAYVGDWRRGFAWALLCGGALAFFSTGALFAEHSGLEPIVITLVRLDGATFADVAFPVAVLVLSVFDLYALAVLETPSYPPEEHDRA
jgi:hypothetical protein